MITNNIPPVNLPVKTPVKLYVKSFLWKPASKCDILCLTADGRGGIFMVRPEYDFRVIGRNLRKLRESKNLSVEDVRQYMQLGTIQAVYKWERGDGLPQADSLLALLALYEVNDYRMLLEEGDSLSSFYLFKFA